MARYYVRTDSSGVYQAWDDVEQTVVFSGTFPVVSKKVDELNAQTQNQQQPTQTKIDTQANDENDKTGATLAGSSTKPRTESEKANMASSTDEFVAKRTWNPLGDFSSYTYRISLYALPPDALNKYNQTGTWFKNDLYLICQSGGINNNPAVDATRAPGFDLDFYIDDLEVKSSINAKDLKQSSNTTEIHFRVTEPYGATFPQKLIDAQKEINARSNFPRKVTNTSESLWGHYLIVFSFYGYDVNGQIINPDKYNTSGNMSKNLDEVAVFERAFPVYINDFKFRLSGKGQIYEISTVSVNTGVGLGTKRAEVSEELSAEGRTVEEALGGNGNTTTGLFDELNKRLQEGQGTTCLIPDEFAVVYESTSKIKKALLIDENINKDRTPLVRVSSTDGSNVRKSASAESSSMQTSRTIKIPGGTPIIQAIDQIISQSSYVSDALNVLESEDPQGAQQGDPTSTANAKPKTLQWYIILPVTEVLGWDKLREDYAYKITYVIRSYDIPYVRSTSISYVPKYPGPHKIYNYWYTGKNTEVISYEQTNNLGYFLYLGSAVKADNAENKAVPAEGVRLQAKPANNADSTGKAPGSFEGPNSIKAWLYSPDDLLQAKLTILGDPDFLMPVTSGTIGQMLTKWYGPNFTINPNSGQVFIELIFNQTEDYSNESGTLPVLDVLDFNNFANQPQPGVQEIAKGTVLMVVMVLSKFHKGKFTQEFEVSLPPFSEMQRGINDNSTPAGGGRETTSTTSTNGSVNPNQSTATAERTGVNLTTGAGGGRGGQGGPTADQAALNKAPPKKQDVYRVVGRGQTPDDDQLVVEGPNFKRKYEPVRGYNHDLERYYADTQNKSRRYGGLKGREAYNPSQDPRRTDN